MPDDQKLEIIVSLKDLTRLGLRTINRGMATFRKSVNLASSAVFSLKGAIATAGIGALGRSFLQASKTAESYRVRLKVLTGSVAEGNRLFQEMAEYASTVSFQYEEIMGAATALTGVLEGGSREVTKWMPLIADLAAASGLGIQETTQQVIRMYSAGAASADLFRERGILAMLGFQAGVSYSAEETRKRLIEAWEGPTSRFRGAAGELATTWEGLMSMMSDRWFTFRTAVMDAGVLDFLKSAVTLLLDFLEELKTTGRLDTFVKDLADGVVTGLEIIAQSVALVGDAWRGWRLIFNGLIALFGTMAEYLNRGLGAMTGSIDSVLTFLEDKIIRLARMIEAIDFTGTAKGVADQLESTKALSKAYDKVIDQTAKSAEYWREVAEEASDTAVMVAGQETYYSRINRVLEKVRKKAAEFRAEAEKAADATGDPRKAAGKPVAALEETLGAGLTELQAIAQTELAGLKQLYDQEQLDLETYFTRRAEILEENFKREAELAKLRADLETKPGKKLARIAKLVQIEEKYQRDLLKLVDERNKEEERLEQKAFDEKQKMRDLKAREAAAIGSNELASQFTAELLLLEEKHAAELEQLRQLKADQAIIEETYRVQQLERDKALAQQRKKLQESILSASKSAFNNLAEFMKYMYQRSGEETKKYFKLFKAAKIAETVISTYESAQKAYSSMLSAGTILGPVLGALAAAAAIAAGTARVAMIRQQSFAEGGKVPGASPHPKADNVPANLTAGEFVEPVSVVKHYGAGLFEAFRRKMVPKDMFTKFNMPNVSAAIGRQHFQAGGAVAAASIAQTQEARDAGEGEGGGGVIINNIVDTRMLGQYLQTTPGQRQIVNIISQNSSAVKTALFNQQTG